MGRFGSHHAEAGRVGQDGQLSVGQNPSVDAAQGGNTQKALVVSHDEKPHLVQMGVQQHPPSVFLAAALHAHYAADAVGVDLIHQWGQQTLGHRHCRFFKAGGGIGLA